MFARISLLANSLAIGFTLPTAVWAGETLPVDELPEPVTEAVKDWFPEGEMLSAEREQDNGRVKYEVMIRDGEKKYEVEVSQEGTILEVELEGE